MLIFGSFQKYSKKKKEKRNARERRGLWKKEEGWHCPRALGSINIILEVTQRQEVEEVVPAPVIKFFGLNVVESFANSSSRLFWRTSFPMRGGQSGADF